VTNKGIRSVSTQFHNLTHLSLASNNIGEEDWGGEEQLLGIGELARHLPQIKHLNLSEKMVM